MEPSRKSLAEAANASISSSDNAFLAAEGVCEQLDEACHSDGVTSLSSTSLTTTHHHHSNPLYTDNEYYDDEDNDIEEDEIRGVKQAEGGASDGHLDAGVEWLQRAPLFGDFSASIISYVVFV